MPEKKKSASKAKPEVKAKKTAKRYSDQQRANRIARYHELMKSGETALTAAKKVGVSYITLLKWEKQTGARKPGKKKAARKAGAARKSARKTGQRRAAAGGLTLVTPNGMRIEGFFAKDLIAVLKELR